MSFLIIFYGKIRLYYLKSNISSTSFLYISQKIYKFARKAYNDIQRYMVNLNWLKVVLVEEAKTDKWLSDQLDNSPCTVSK